MISFKSQVEKTQLFFWPEYLPLVGGCPCKVASKPCLERLNGLVERNNARLLRSVVSMKSCNAKCFPSACVLIRKIWAFHDPQKISGAVGWTLRLEQTCSHFQSCRFLKMLHGSSCLGSCKQTCTIPCGSQEFE